MTRLLLIEDDIGTANLIRWRLVKDGYEVTHEPDGIRGLQSAARELPELVILDWGLPGMDGLEVCRRLRQFTQIPILMLTASGDVDDRIRGFEQGASDYLPKPFSPEELVARVKAQLMLARPQARTRLSFEDLHLDLRTYEVRRNNRAIQLTPKEFELLRMLLSDARQVIPRQRLIESIWGHNFEGEDSVLDVFIATLRKKVDPPGEAKLIHTVRGVGYVLKADPVGA